MPRRTTRNFLRKFRRFGIEIMGKPPRMSEDIQLVTVVDDFSWPKEAEPEDIYVGVATGISGPGGRHATFELECRAPNGLILDGVVVAVSSGTEQVDMYILEEEEDMIRIIDPAPSLLTSRPGARSIAATGSISCATLFSRTGRMQDNRVTNFPAMRYGFPISFGRFLYVVAGQPAVFASIGAYYHELQDSDPAP